ncbi:MAG: hypothetical protein EBU34_05940 [Alphaproteobacteria bacterium]|nr:hypothetical protein [Alphaproteobacteria bacterium]
MRGRYAEAFIGNRRDEVKAYLLIAALISLYGFGLYYVGFTPMMLINGFGKFGIVVKAMMPPDPGSWDNAIVFMRGVIETLAMAFFGTICAAFLALPFGFLAARNIVSNSIIHHAVRRFLDIIRQILPVLLGQVLYFFESNTRTTTIIGIVGAGGIGLYLTETIRTYLWEETSFIIMLVLVTVAAIDFISSKLRVAIIGSRPV